MAGTPLLVAAIVCDQAIREEGTHKWSLIGVFSRVTVQTIPALHPSMALYLAITEIHDEIDFKVEALAGEGPEEKKLVEAHGKIKTADPRVVGEMVMRFPAFPIVQEGVHSIRVTSGSERIGSTKFYVERVKP